jgi:hypothetical protein
LHGVILMVGGHYTYAEMPLFNWLRDSFDLARNHYDRVGHVAQGFIPGHRRARTPAAPVAAAARQVAVFPDLRFCLAISAFYEMIEWWVALASGDEAVAFLATQGDVWDTQWDMFLALLGALSSQLLLGRWHDRQLARIIPRLLHERLLRPRRLPPVRAGRIGYSPRRPIQPGGIREGGHRSAAGLWRGAGFGAYRQDCAAGAGSVGKTPARRLRDGSGRSPGRGFADPREDMVVVRGIAVHGVCPHHLVPFRGVAHVAYVPGGRLHGFGRIARLVDAIGHRFTYQEWMTRDIVEALVNHGRQRARPASSRRNSCACCWARTGAATSGS